MQSRPEPREIGWYCWNSEATTHPVRGLQPNAFGLYDMAGNVGEWINDRSDGHRRRNERGAW
jgi:formylglycine-generating enzyme required for sulfatase activity